MCNLPSLRVSGVSLWGVFKNKLAEFIKANFSLSVSGQLLVKCSCMCSTRPYSHLCYHNTSAYFSEVFIKTSSTPCINTLKEIMISMKECLDSFFDLFAYLCYFILMVRIRFLNAPFILYFIDEVVFIKSYVWFSEKVFLELASLTRVFGCKYELPC